MAKKKADKFWVDMRLHPAEVTIKGWRQQIQLPEGCVGIMFVFKTRAAAHIL